MAVETGTEAERLNELIEQLNAGLSEITPYKLALVPPSEVKPLDKNAHYMSKRTFGQLAENIKKDGNLSSLPFCWKLDDGRYESLSGNHRIQAAGKAGVPAILVLYTDKKLSRQEQVSIQLSHNSLVGKENPQLLRELWDEMSELHMKIYSGLDDELLKTLQPVDISRLVDANLKFEEVRLLFIEPEVEKIELVMKKLGNSSKDRFVGHYQDFDRFFELLLAFKDKTGILNSATAFMAMIDIVQEWMNTKEGST